MKIFLQSDNEISSEFSTDYVERSNVQNPSVFFITVQGQMDCCLHLLVERCKNKSSNLSLLYKPDRLS